MFCLVRFGCKHPDPVVETSSLSSVEVPNVSYSLLIPEEVIDYGYLSALQLEAIVYACQKHETTLPSGERAAFLIGQFDALAVFWIIDSAVMGDSVA